MMKSRLLNVVFLITPLLFQPVLAEPLDYQVIFQQVNTSRIDPETNVRTETLNNDIWYGTFSIDSTYIPSSGSAPIEDFTASIGEIIFNNPSSGNFNLLGSGDDWLRLVGSLVEPNPDTGDRLAFSTTYGTGVTGWGAFLSDSYETRYFGTHSFILETSRDDDVIKNGRFVRGDCGEITTCETWATTGSVQTRELVAGTGNYVAELTTASDAILSQVIDTPDGAFRLNFEHLFQTSTGVLDIYLGSSLLGSLAASPASELTSMSILVDDPSLLGLTGEAMSFNLNGQMGSQVLLDNIAITSAVPIPASVWLFGSGLLGLIGIARRKKV